MILANFNLNVLGAGTFLSSEFTVDNLQLMRNLLVEFQGAGLSGGTSVNGYLQTSLDEGLTWGDIANISLATTPATKRVNLSSATPVTTQNTPGDGALTANTAVDGLLGGRFRVKAVILGAYANPSTLKVFAFGQRLRKV